MSKYGFEKGDLLKYIDYVKNESYVGLYLRPVEYPATGGNDVHLLIPVILAGEGNPLSIRRELGKQIETRMCCQPGGTSTTRRCHPQVTRVDEHNAGAMNIRKP